jgi:EpsI family protein
MLSTRPFVAALVLAGGIFATHSIPTPNAPEAHQPLREFPVVVSLWRSEDRPYKPDVVKAIGADDYINRVYSGGALPIQLFIGYYKDQRSGDRIHSPKNCLPGSGWEPVRSGRLQIGSERGRPVMVNEFVVEQGTSRDMVLYWYQSRRRIIASEYWAKYWLVVDGLRDRTTDGAMVRIWTTAADGEENARTRATEFASRIYPQVAELLPQSSNQP